MADVHAPIGKVPDRIFADEGCNQLRKAFVFKSGFSLFYVPRSYNPKQEPSLASFSARFGFSGCAQGLNLQRAKMA